MASKKNYLIRVWSITGGKVGTTLDNIIETSHSGFDLVQERIIKSYEINIILWRAKIFQFYFPICFSN